MTYSLLTRPDRLAALRRTALLDTPPEEAFDRLTRMAARLLGTPISLISLVTDERQFFKSATGLPEPWASRRVSPISFSFCGHVVATGEPLVVEDARRHPLLRHSQAIRELGWVAYAGVPLITRQGHTVGSFSVVDKMPRVWSERDIGLLQDLAASAVTEIELRGEVAERRQAEQARRESEDQFHSTFEESGIGMAVISIDGRWLRVNRALTEMLDSARDELIGFSTEARTHPDDVAADREAVRLLLAGEARTYTTEKRYTRPSGEVLWALVNVSLVTSPEGEPLHLIAAIQEFTERKKAEAELQQSQDRYRLVAEASGEAVWDWDLVTDRVTWDAGTGPLLDYSRSDLGETASWWYDRIHPEDRERVVASIDAAIASSATSWFEEYRFRRLDGSYASVRDRAHLAKDSAGLPVRVISAMSDLGQTRGADPRLNQVLESLPVGVWLFDSDGRVVLANQAVRQIWGETPVTSLEDLSRFNPRWPTGEPVEASEWGIARALRSSETSVDEELTIGTPDTGYKTVLVSAVPVHGPAGEVAGAVSVTQDITQRRAGEAALLRKEQQLHRAQKMDAIGQLAGGIAHDFNNLLTGILSYSDLILQELRPADPIREDVEQIRDAGHRAAALTRQLLAFSRRQLLQPRVISLNTLISSVEPMLHRLVGNQVNLHIELDQSLGNVRADPSQLEQILVNLAINARDAMPSGGRLAITTATLELEGEEDDLLRETAMAPGSYIVLRVSDTGTGMDQATQSQIFEPFFTTRHGSGRRGLGLPTVYGIVEQSGGHVTVESEPGEGTTFTIYLPRYDGAEPVSSPTTHPLAEGGTETILLVEDEPTVRASVRRLLEWHGYTVLEARNGIDALQIYDDNETRIDLVLTDMIMPEMGGRELVDRLRAGRTGLKVLYMSGYTEEAALRNGSVPRDTGFVEKPFTVETLMRRLRQVLDER
jgi:two-component system, cell cycle sensor histidine kinase and response regulator CckA